MIFVTTAATATRLTTVQAVRDQFGIAAGDLNDAGVQTLIDRASAAVVSYCNRPFAREAVRQLVWPTRPRQTVSLERWPASSVVVTEGGTALEADTDYYHDEERSLLLRICGGLPSCWSTDTIEITYNGGYVVPGEEGANLPADVEHAIILLVGDMWQMISRAEGGTLKRERVDNVTELEWYVPGAASSLSNPTSEMLLSRYRKPAI